MAVTNARNQPIDHASNSAASEIPACSTHRLLPQFLPHLLSFSSHSATNPVSKRYISPSSPTGRGCTPGCPRLQAARPRHSRTTFGDHPARHRAGSPSTATRAATASRSRCWRLPSRRRRHRSSASTGTLDRSQGPGHTRCRAAPRSASARSPTRGPAAPPPASAIGSPSSPRAADLLCGTSVK